MILAILWQIVVKNIVLREINLKEFIGLVCILNGGEQLRDFFKLSQEDLLLRSFKRSRI